MASVEQVSQPALRKTSLPLEAGSGSWGALGPSPFLLSAPIDPAAAQGQVAGGQGHSTT